MVAGTPGLFRTNLVSTSTPSLSPSTNAPVVAASHNGESECWEQATDGKAASNHFAGYQICDTVPSSSLGASPAIVPLPRSLRSPLALSPPHP
ncbi:hypothetical protein VDGL01_01577 [Verticillium dahliae]